MLRIVYLLCICIMHAFKHTTSDLQIIYPSIFVTRKLTVAWRRHMATQIWVNIGSCNGLGAWRHQAIELMLIEVSKTQWQLFEGNFIMDNSYIYQLNYVENFIKISQGSNGTVKWRSRAMSVCIVGMEQTYIGMCLVSSFVFVSNLNPNPKWVQSHKG